MCKIERVHKNWACAHAIRWNPACTVLVPSLIGDPVRPGAVSLDRALCLPTFSHFVMVNKAPLSLCVFSFFELLILNDEINHLLSMRGGDQGIPIVNTRVGRSLPDVRTPAKSNLLTICA